MQWSKLRKKDCECLPEIKKRTSISPCYVHGKKNKKSDLFEQEPPDQMVRRFGMDYRFTK